MRDEKRRAEIRARVAAHLATVSALCDEVTSDHLRAELKRARNYLEDVDRMFLNLADVQTPAEEDRRLGYAERIAEDGVSVLRSVQDTVAKYGINAQANTDLR